MEEIKYVIKCMNKEKAIGQDSIAAKMLKVLSQNIKMKFLKYLIKCFNQVNCHKNFLNPSLSAYRKKLKQSNVMIIEPLASCHMILSCYLKLSLRG